MTKDTLDQLVAQAAEYQLHLTRVKESNPSPEFPWYPYDSIGSFSLLSKFIDDERRDLRKLLGQGPVLDLCCADGDLSFFIETLGTQVHALDWPVTNMNFMHGVQRMKELLNSKVEIYPCNLDSRFQLPAQYYSAAFFFGGLYHLKNPFYVLEELAKHVYWCFLSTRVARYMPDHTTMVRDFPVAYLVGPEELNGDHTNYWIFSEGGLKRILNRTGWGVCDFTTFGNASSSDPVQPDRDERAFCLLRSRILTGDSVVTLLEGWHELEEDAWRWTSRRFALRISNLPASSGRMVLPFVLPEPVFQHTGPITLRVTVNGVALPPQNYVRPGTCQFVAPLRGLGDTLLAEFEVDKALPPQPNDNRERALIIRPSDVEKLLVW